MLIVTELFDIAVNYLNTKISALCSRMLVVTELVVGGTQCNLWWRELCSLQPGARYNETRSKRDPVWLLYSSRRYRSDQRSVLLQTPDVMMYSPCVAINYYHYAVNKFTIVTSFLCCRYRIFFFASFPDLEGASPIHVLDYARSIL